MPDQNNYILTLVAYDPATGAITHQFQADDTDSNEANAIANGCTHWIFATGDVDPGELLVRNGELVDKSPADAAELLASERAAMTVPRAAFRLALANLPGPEGYEDALDYADAIGSDPMTPRVIRILWADAATFNRLNADIVAWFPILAHAVVPRLTQPNALADEIFRLAMALDANDATAIAAVQVRLQGLLA